MDGRGPGWASLEALKSLQPEGVVRTLREWVNQVPSHQAVRLKAAYTFLLALLEEADHAASRAFDTGSDPVSGLLLGDAATTGRHLRQEVRRRLGTGRLRAFQRRAGRAGAEGEPNLVLAVPCGRGKTEAALLWWAGLAELGKVDRLVWAMPTQVTSNALYDRLVEIAGPDAVGLYHGYSLLERERRGCQQGRADGGPCPLQTDPEALRSENRLGEWFVRTVTATTVDHLLFTFCHGFGKADYALGNLQCAAVVFDEVHYYDHQMLAHLRETFGLLRAMGIPHLLMSGTLPASLLRAFGINVPRDRAPAGPSREPSYRLVEDREGERHRPFRLRRAEGPLLVDGGESGLVLSPDALADLQEGRARGWVQVVILNTVRRAQSVYRQLADLLGPDRIGLLHSRFAYADRRRHEESFLSRCRRHEAGLILVATQVVEVSLDLSADRMLSELAPLDALGQRGGRVHRGCRRPDGRELSVWLPPDGLPYQRGEKALEDPQGILRRSWEALPTGVPAQGEWRERCDRLYADRALGSSNLPELFRACTLFGPSPYEIRFDEWSGRVFKPRAVLQPTVNVVSRDLMDELGEEALNDLWQVPVPQWWVLRSLAEKTEHFIPHTHLGRSYLLCTLPYSHQLGFCESGDQARHGAFIDLD